MFVKKEIFMVGPKNKTGFVNRTHILFVCFFQTTYSIIYKVSEFNAKNLSRVFHMIVFASYFNNNCLGHAEFILWYIDKNEKNYE